MGESRNHIDLVQIAYEYIKTIVSKDKHALIQIDSADSNRPTAVNGSVIPDVQYWEGDLYIIGEAKTLNDFDREHSLLQYDVYLTECGKFHGKAILVVAVPWQIVITAKNYFRRRRKQLDVEFDIVILNEGGGEFHI